MNPEIGKTADSKRRLREAMASLTFAEKLEIVEELRGENPVRLLNVPVGEIKGGQAESVRESLLLKFIQDTVAGFPKGRGIQSGGVEDKRLTAEVGEMSGRKDRVWEALKALLPEGVAPDALFFDRLRKLQSRLGWTATSNRITGLLLLAALDHLTTEAGELLLGELLRMASPYFFQTLEILPVLLAERTLRPEFAAEWFTALVHRIGNDLASAGFWNALGAYCEKRPGNALEVLSRLSATETEEQIRIAAYLLGAVRRLELRAKDRGRLEASELEFAESREIGKRSIHHRSWIETARRGALSRRDLELLVDRMMAGSATEREQVYWVVIASILSPAIATDCFVFGLSWLRANVSGNIAPAAKFHVVDFAVRISPAHRQEAGELILLAQPFPVEHKGLWQRLEHFLVPWLQTDLAGFKSFCLELANRNARNWLEVMDQPQNFDWFLFEIRGQDVGDMVEKLVLSSSSDCRNLGLFLLHPKTCLMSETQSVLVQIRL